MMFMFPLFDVYSTLVCICWHFDVSWAHWECSNREAVKCDWLYKSLVLPAFMLITTCCVFIQVSYFKYIVDLLYCFVGF